MTQNQAIGGAARDGGMGGDDRYRWALVLVFSRWPKFDPTGGALPLPFPSYVFPLNLYRATS
jgi:hypothetical protein